MPPPAAIVVTGATGFTGPFVVREIERRLPDAAVRCLVRSGSNREGLSGTRVAFCEGDLNDGASLDRAFEGADTLVHVASLGFGWVDSLFDAIARSRLRRGVFVSTTAILTKLAVGSRPQRERGEARVRASGLDWTIVRPTMIYGTPGDRNIARLIRFVQRSPVIPIVAPDALQQPVHVEDVASAVVACLSASASVGRTYTLSGRDALTFEGLVRETARAVGRRRLVMRLPFAPVLGAVMLYNAVVSRPRIRVEQVQRLREDKAFDHDAAHNDLGFLPRAFADGVRQEVRLMCS